MTNPARCRREAQDEASRAIGGSCRVESNRDLFFDRIFGELLVRRDRLAVLAKAVQVSADRIGRHRPGFLQGITFSHEARQGWTRNNVAAFLGWLKQDGILDLFTNW